MHLIRLKPASKRFLNILSRLKRRFAPPRPIKYMQIKKMFPRVLSVSETVIMLQQGASICRFGDAEFDIMLKKNSNDPYQRPSEQLSIRLKSVLKAQEHNLIVSIPPFKDKFDKKIYGLYSFWEWYWISRFNEISSYLSLSNVYGNSLVSRTSAFKEVEISEFNKIWAHKAVVLIKGKRSRFVFDERLFKDIRVVGEINVPATNAFEEYDRILSDALDYEPDTLYLVAAGPTATILCYDLHIYGRHALDIGHISNCYLEHLGEALSPESYPMEKAK